MTRCESDKMLNRMAKLAMQSGDTFQKRIARAIRKRSCGGCELCCEILHVPGITEANEPCEHQSHGCGIYKDRPLACREWACMWRYGCGPESARPDKVDALVSIDRENEDHGKFASVRFTRPFNPAPIKDLIQDAVRAFGDMHIALIGPDADAGRCLYFGAMETVLAHIDLASQSGISPWNPQQGGEDPRQEK